ncbi:MAG TPA: DUF4034 domain-containing protein [Candidatus Eisenbacteria bacterium]|nr:DUF4034 domain-containing protein [Candidatus Eisenbacteria bacterium]
MRPYAVLALILSAALTTGCVPSRHSHAAQARVQAQADEELRLHFAVSNAKLDRARFGLRVRTLLLERRYIELEALADSTRSTNASFPSGSSMVSSFYYWAFQSADDSDLPAETWEQLLHNLRQWREGQPRSATATIALANALIQRGWAARGGGYAHTVKASQWPKFADDIAEARQLLRRAERIGHDCPGWYEAMLEVALCSSASDQEYDRIFDEGVAAFPTHAELYTAKSRRLMPRWFGEPGDWERFAAEVADRNPGGRGPELYARIIYFQSGYTNNVFEDSPAVTWERVRVGLEAWRKRCPESALPLSLLARFAAQANRPGECRNAFRELGKRVDLAAWNDDAGFWHRCRSWAIASAGLRRRGEEPGGTT